MAYTAVNKYTEHFFIKTYAGTGSAQTISGLPFQPDFTWIKDREGSDSHNVYDSVRGVLKMLRTDGHNEEDSQSAGTGLTAWTSDGFSIGTNSSLNGNGNGFVSWHFKAGGAASSNTDGDITSSVSVNSTAGFSIVKYTGSGTDGHTVGHGLGGTPAMVIQKRLDGAIGGWRVWIDAVHDNTGETDTLFFQTTAANGSDSDNISGANATTFITRGTGATNPSGNNCVAYCFKNIPGFSKIQTYTGNGSSDGPMIYTGFKPAFIIFKRYDGGTENWAMMDSTRSYHNTGNHTLATNSANAESSFGGGESVDGGSNKNDIISNGIKIKEASNYNNTSGANYVCIAFGQTLVGTNNVPVTAR